MTPGRNLDLTLSPENEWLCARILLALGPPVTGCHVARFGARKALVVVRFDRQCQADPASLVRIPQEDFCQVLGRSSADNYEGNGGPGMDDCLRVLKGGTRFEADGRYHLTPLYDVLSAGPILDCGPYSLSYKKVKMP